MMEKNWSKARLALNNSSAPVESPETREPLDGLIQEAGNLRYRSPIASGMLSVVIPGLGKVYAGRLYDALYSTMVIALSTWLAYDGFRDDGRHSIKGWVFSGASAFFYLGNVYGSVLAARSFNRGQDNELRRKILDVANPLLNNPVLDLQPAGSR
jgi:hypothetical protein